MNAILVFESEFQPSLSAAERLPGLLRVLPEGDSRVPVSHLHVCLWLCALGCLPGGTVAPLASSQYLLCALTLAFCLDSLPSSV